MSRPAFLIHLDAPGNFPLGEPFFVRGWVASLTPILAVRAGDANDPGLAFGDRPDVRAAHPDYPHSTGFSGYAFFAGLQGDDLHLACAAQATRSGQDARFVPNRCAAERGADSSQREEFYLGGGCATLGQRAKLAQSDVTCGYF